jgi:hypothetical protein
MRGRGRESDEEIWRSRGGVWVDGKERGRGSGTNLDDAVEDAADANAVLEDAVDLEDVIEADATDLLLLHDPICVHLEQHVGDARRRASLPRRELLEQDRHKPWVLRRVGMPATLDKAGEVLGHLEREQGLFPSLDVLACVLALPVAILERDLVGE